MDYFNGEKPDTVPAGPWQWQTVRPADSPEVTGEEWVAPSSDEHGQALVAADGTWLRWSEGGNGTPTVYNEAVEELLRQAWQVPVLRDELDEARNWARGYRTGCSRSTPTIRLADGTPRGRRMNSLTEQLEDDLEEARLYAWCLFRGKPLNLPGEPLPAWLTCPVPPVGR